MTVSSCYHYGTIRPYLAVNEGAIPLVWYGHLRVGYTLPFYTDQAHTWQWHRWKGQSFFIIKQYICICPNYQSLWKGLLKLFSILFLVSRSKRAKEGTKTLWIKNFFTSWAFYLIFFAPCAAVTLALDLDCLFSPSNSWDHNLVVKHYFFINSFFDETLTGTTIPGQSGPKSNGDEGVLHTPQGPRTGTSPPV